MEIQFENKRGVLRFFGGGERGDWHLLDVEGLGIPEILTQTVTYYGENGQKTVSKSLRERPITLTVEVKGQSRNDRAMIVSKAMKILAEEGVLSVRTYCEKVVDCYLKSCAEGARDGNFRTYVLQFVCDSPYFRNRKITEVDLFNRVDLLKDDFVIGDGIVLTQRIAGGIINNNSDVIVRGTIALGSGSTEGSITVTNKTVNASLKFEMDANKKYTIDLDNRTITDESGENCIEILSEDCYMSDFYLAEGINEIEVVTENGTSLEGSMIYSFYKQYVEATD